MERVCAACYVESKNPGAGNANARVSAVEGESWREGFRDWGRERGELEGEGRMRNWRGKKRGGGIGREWEDRIGKLTSAFFFSSQSVGILLLVPPFSPRNMIPPLAQAPMEFLM